MDKVIIHSREDLMRVYSKAPQKIQDEVRGGPIFHDCVTEELGGCVINGTAGRKMKITCSYTDADGHTHTSTRTWCSPGSG